MTENNEPLVSVIVVTYNAEKTVLETLESVKRQNYSHIELIITDDHSSDNTIRICEEWMAANHIHFVNTQIITSEQNTGITPNRNRGIKAASGTWLKQIDGDDMLKDTCIKHYVDFVQENTTADIIFSPLELFGNENMELWASLMYTNFDCIVGLSPDELRILLCKICLFPAPSAFIKTSFFWSVGGYDESIIFLEDWPFWVKAAFNGAKFAYLRTPEVLYRISATSLSQGTEGVNVKFQEAIRLTELKTLDYMKSVSMLYYWEGLILYQCKYNRNLFWTMLSYLRPLNPYFWKVRRLHKQYISFRKKQQ